MSGTAQQFPFIPVTGPDEVKGSSFLFEDSRGGLWLGGSEGSYELRYFDGTRFVNPVAGTYPKAFVSGMSEDSEGGIWLASDRGLFRVFRGNVQRILSGPTGLGIAKIGADIFLTAHWNKSPSEYELIRITRAGPGWKTEDLMKVVQGAEFRLDASGNVLYPCEDGFCEFRSEDARSWRIGARLPVTRHRLVPPHRAQVVLRDRFGCVWMSGFNDMAYQCPGDSKYFVLPTSVASVAYPEISEMDDGTMVLPSFGRIAIGRPGHFRVMTMANGYTSAGPHLVGKDGSIWISNANGLFVFPSRLCMEFWTEREGLNGNTWSILPMGKKVFAISADTIEVLNDDRSRWHPLVQFSGATHLMAGPGNTILASSRTAGVIQISAEGRILRKSAPANVMMMAQTADHQIWATGSEISHISFDGDRLILHPEVVPSPRGGGVDMEADGHGDLWTCYAAGLLRRTEANWRLLPIKDGLPSGCRTFTIDSENRAWYGTLSTLSLIQNPDANRPDSRNMTMEAVPVPNFLGSDKADRLWLGTSAGVYIADPAQALHRQWLKLDRSAGLPGNDTNQRSFVADKDGSVWFGIDSSVVHIFPADHLVHPTYSPAVFVSGFSWDDGTFHMADMVNTIRSGADVTVHLGSLQMDRRNALNYRYRLLPRQTAWTMGTSADINLGKLSWGDEQFEVQARLETGPWSKTATKVLHVSRPIWLSTPFVLGFVFAGGVAAVGGLQWRRKRKRREETPLPGLADWRLAVISPDEAGLSGRLVEKRFKLVRIMARGGFAKVWEAQDRKQKDRVCAVKIFRHELFDKGWLEKRFRHEVLALTQIDHPNVVRIYSYGTLPGGAPYLVMEYIHGQTLRETLKQSRLSNARIASYMRQTTAALAEIHAHGICHRDVKPENLMIRSHADPARNLVLIDFSIAIVQDPNKTIHGLSRAAGTIAYMAPEQVIGYANESSDIYSLAKTLIEMLAGRRLSDLLPDASIDLPDRVRELLRDLRVGLSDASINLVAEALEFDPSRRPRDAKAFGDQLARDLER